MTSALLVLQQLPQNLLAAACWRCRTPVQQKCCGEGDLLLKAVGSSSSSGQQQAT
jgi:hypothetical protein